MAGLTDTSPDQAEHLDRIYLTRWAIELGLADLLTKVWQRAGFNS